MHMLPVLIYVTNPYISRNCRRNCRRAGRKEEHLSLQPPQLPALRQPGVECLRASAINLGTSFLTQTDNNNTAATATTPLRTSGYLRPRSCLGAVHCSLEIARRAGGKKVKRRAGSRRGGLLGALNSFSTSLG
jgi:hypothetical protein